MKAQEDKWRYSSSLTLTSALDGVTGQCHAPAALPAGKRNSAYYTGGWVGPRVWLHGLGKFAPTGILSPDRPAPSHIKVRCDTKIYTWQI
jgi:hypothetical protein